jgi:conjugative relaxase-like TrwC/TraI family protein
MLKLSKPMTAAALRTYHAEEFSNARGNYYTEGEPASGRWHGRLAQQWGLSGAVDEQQIYRLADGRHPTTDAQLVRPVRRAYINARGDAVKVMEHRAGWDVTVSAPKSVSLTALVGGDPRVAAAHRASVRAALDRTERYVQGRVGGNHPPETTGEWIAAVFDHDSARPVDGYAAPHLHSHVVVFNLAQRKDGRPASLESWELYKSQQLATAVYRSELASRLAAIGYEIDGGASGQPEIRGYTREYLEASSPRTRKIREHLEARHLSGAGAHRIAAYRTREPKLDVSHEEMRRRHQVIVAAFEEQPNLVVEAARQMGSRGLDYEPRVTPSDAVTFAQDRNFERRGVADERALLGDALRRSMGEVGVEAIYTEFERRIERGDLVLLNPRPGAAARLLTSREMLELERDTVHLMRAGRDIQPPLVTHVTRRDIRLAYQHLGEHQRAAVDQALGSHDQVQALEVVARSGRTTALTAVREAAQREGYDVEGSAPTWRGARTLSEAGIASTTLEELLVRRDDPSDRRLRLYVIDASLANTKQMNALLHRLTSRDRVLLVGHAGQHQALGLGDPGRNLELRTQNSELRTQN